MSENNWVIIDSFFRDNEKFLVSHQLDSFNDFIDVKINDIINGFNPIVMRYDYNPELDNYTYEISIHVNNFIMTKPTIYENDGVTKEMLPEEARLRNMTYSASIYCDIQITVAHRIGKSIEIKTKHIPNLSLGKMPIMIRSKYCNLQNNYNILVAAPLEQRLINIAKRDGLLPAQIDKIMANQLPESEKVPFVDFIIHNDESHSLIEQVLAIHHQLLNQ